MLTRRFQFLRVFSPTYSFFFFALLDFVDFISQCLRENLIFLLLHNNLLIFTRVVSSNRFAYFIYDNWKINFNIIFFKALATARHIVFD